MHLYITSRYRTHSMEPLRCGLLSTGKVRLKHQSLKREYAFQSLYLCLVGYVYAYTCAFSCYIYIYINISIGPFVYALVLMHVVICTRTPTATCLHTKLYSPMYTRSVEPGSFLQRPGLNIGELLLSNRRSFHHYQPHLSLNIFVNLTCPSTPTSIVTQHLYRSH